MKQKRYFVNPHGIIFLPAVDKKNDYRTIASNPRSKNLLMINRVGYTVLKSINDCPGILFGDILGLTSNALGSADWQNQAKVREFLDQMIDENIVVQAG